MAGEEKRASRQRGRYTLTGLARALRGEASFRTEIGASSLVGHAHSAHGGNSRGRAAQHGNRNSGRSRQNPNLDPLIGHAKDLGAAAVFVLSVAAILLAICLLWSFCHGAAGFAPPP